MRIQCLTQRKTAKRLGSLLDTTVGFTSSLTLRLKTVMDGPLKQSVRKGI